MSIFVSEPGRPVGTRLPEAFRARRVGDVTGLSDSHPVVPGDAREREAVGAGGGQLPDRRRALEEYSMAGAADAREQRPYLPVRDLCSRTLYTVPATATVTDALTAMDDNAVHHLVVMSDTNVAGLIDLRWLLAWVQRQIREPESAASPPLNQLLTQIELPAFLTAFEETDAHQLARLMLAHQLTAALVVNPGGDPVGVVTSTDYLRLYAASASQAPDTA
ncbi:CBS domain-containing protein [Marinobacter sp. C2H3]|uniref:CBS domain-containing protein n=1 Tax=Marinobacter sp. C2H3 TaxID=3119003 RepID=UPI00300E8BC0